MIPQTSSPPGEERCHAALVVSQQRGQGHEGLAGNTHQGEGAGNKQPCKLTGGKWELYLEAIAQRFVVKPNLFDRNALNKQNELSQPLRVAAVHQSPTVFSSGKLEAQREYVLRYHGVASVEEIVYTARASLYVRALQVQVSAPVRSCVARERPPDKFIKFHLLLNH